VIALLDYGAGNLTSVRKALHAVGASVWTPGSAAELTRATGVIVPGVGHFAATRGLNEHWRGAIHAALDRGIPLLGICVGLQWLFEGSTEAPDVPGLGAIPGHCTRLGDRPGVTWPAPKVPHVGWNALSIAGPSRLLDGIADATQVYFTHSYAAPLVEATIATTSHGTVFTAATEAGLVSGVQFHPEKSGGAGLRVLANWSRCVE
jgi:glutamine amidotransferase